MVPEVGPLSSLASWDRLAPDALRPSVYDCGRRVELFCNQLDSLADVPGTA